MEKTEGRPNGGTQPESTVPQVTDLEKNEPTQETANEYNAFLVKFDKGDPEDPKNFNPFFKAFLLFEMALLAFAGSTGTSIISPADAVISDYLGVSVEVTVLTLALFVLGS
jgi:hypothetical protein